jgi:hypothetical protein
MHMFRGVLLRYEQCQRCEFKGTVSGSQSSCNPVTQQSSGASHCHFFQLTGLSGTSK